jgi:hypothetical protein
MLSSILTGPVIGGIMSAGSHILSGVTNYFAAKQALESRKLEMSHEAAMFPLKLEASKEENAWRGFLSSQEAAKDVGDNALPWAATVVAITRPALTLLVLLVVACCLPWISTDQRTGLLATLIDMFGVAFGWWFGNRQLSKATK